MSPLDVLRADPVERAVLLELIEPVLRAGQERDRLLANRIIVELGEAMKRTPRKPLVSPDG